ncbi:MAG: glycosyltransferase family 4 protein, partial [Vicinamibacterales bacterium]
MTTPRIAVDVTPIRPGGECGGAKPFVLQLLKDLAAAPRRHEYVLLTADHNHDLFASHEAQNVVRRRIDTGDPPSAARQLRDSGIDLLFCPMTAPTYATDGIPTVSILYDLQHLAYPTFFKAEELMHRARFYQDLVRRVDHVVCISEYSRASLIEHFHVPRERTSVVPIAIQDRLPHFDATAAWEILTSRGLPRCRYAFYPANFWPHKNHRMLLLAFARFVLERPDADIHLVLTGDLLDQGDAIRAAVQRMGLASRVHLMGFVPEADLGALWSAASFLVFPSLFEGFGIPLTEAMSFGVPIVCSQQGSLPEVAGDTAVYFDARDPQAIVNALALAWDEPQEPRAVRQRVQERLSVFRPDVVVEQYLDVFDRTMAQSSSRVSSAGQRGSPQGRRWQTRAVARLHSGRNLYQSGRPLRGVFNFALGALVTPRHAGHLLKGALKPLVFEARTRVFGRRRLPLRVE